MMNAENNCEFEYTAGATYIEVNQSEDEEDIREGLKALADRDGTKTWGEYQVSKEVKE